MKILPIEDIRRADNFTIKHEPIADIDLMERAATALHDWIKQRAKKNNTIKIFCGLGNNGGDGLALGRLLGKSGFQVSMFLIKYSDRFSESCQINFERAQKVQEIKLIELNKGDELPAIDKDDLIIDAIFGSGLTRPVKGFLSSLVDHINAHKNVVIAIDAPTGFFCDVSNTTNQGAIIKADYTLTFQFPKFGFLFPENEAYIGDWQVIDIGLHPDFIKEYKAQYHFILRDDCARMHKPRAKFSHKGTYGHGLLIAGSYGKMGAAILAAKAGLKAGAGLISAHIPRSGNTIMQTAAPEVMVNMDDDDFYFSSPPDLSTYNALAIGPGLGTKEKSQKALKLLIQNLGSPLILDADALNILSENKTWIAFLPENSILTPHPKEFERLAGKSSNDFDRHAKQREFSIKNHCYVVLKGAHTCISTPSGNSYFNSSGNPGMATGGTGDVLTGIILGLLSQNYSPLESCILGVFIHGLAGDKAARKEGYEALTAGDIISNLGWAFKRIS